MLIAAMVEREARTSCSNGSTKERARPPSDVPCRAAETNPAKMHEGGAVLALRCVRHDANVAPGKEATMSILLLLIILLIVVGGLPTWGYHSFGYAPSGVGGILLIIIILLILTGRL